MTTTDNTTTVRLTGRGGLLAAVPAMLGFHPEESLVVVCMSGPARRVGPVIRVDLDDQVTRPAGRVAQLQMHVRRYADEVALMCYTENEARPALFERLLAALERDGTRVLDAVLVRDGRASSARTFPTGCRDTDDVDDIGSEVPGDTDPQVCAMAAAIALTGRGILADRQALSDSIAGPTGRAAAKASAALHAAAEGLLGQVGASGPIDHERLRLLATTTLDRAFVQAERTGNVEPATCALVALLLCEIGIRDEVIGRAVNETDGPWLPMLIGVARTTADQDAAEICAVLAVAAYRRGDGALAQVAIDRCLRSEPDHRLAHLMLGVMASGLPPAELVHLAGVGSIVNPGTDG